MTQIQATECSQGEQISAFLANRLGPDSRHSFVAHLGVCEHCASLLRDLREDERLARLPLTAQERSSIRAIVGAARAEVNVRLENDRGRQQEESSRAPAQALITPPRLLGVIPDLHRPLWLAAAAACLLAAAGWWLFGK